MNKPDFSKFYHTTDASNVVTLLFSTTVFKLELTGSLTADPNLNTEMPSTLSYDKADKLCYGSNEVHGLVTFF